MGHNIPRVVIAAAASGCGKTTVVTGLLAALHQQGIKAQSYKIGPDYIDPGYHKLASGTVAHNIDTWLMSKEAMLNIFIDTAQGADIAIIEGVMGLYDGGKKGVSSTAQIAKFLNAPVLLVLDCKSMGTSAAAVALGFKEFDPEVQLAGVILNRLGSANHQHMIEEALSKRRIPVIGAIRRNEALIMPERHLGLLPVEENEERQVVEAMASAMKKQLNIAEIMQLAHHAQPLEKVNNPDDAYVQQIVEGRRRSFPDDFGKIKIGVARDEAFSFYYAESLAVLERLGAQLVEFSPLHDAELPDVDGLLIGGGFPEMFAKELEENTAMLWSIRKAAKDGMPILGECGGYMYLSQSVTDFDGNSHQMTGIFSGRAEMQKRLQMVGYVEAELLRDCCLGRAGLKLKGHEFHFSSTEKRDVAELLENSAFKFTRMRNGAVYAGGSINAAGNVLGSYLHIHFAGCPKAAAGFVGSCWNYSLKRQNA